MADNRSVRVGTSALHMEILELLIKELKDHDETTAKNMIRTAIRNCGIPVVSDGVHGTAGVRMVYGVLMFGSYPE